MKLIPKNWSEFQQYKDRKPQWIKFHRELLNDFAYSSVHINTKAVLPLLWLLACEYDDGIIEASIEEIAFRIHIDEKTVEKAVKELIERKFFTSVQECTELYKNVPREEKRREETEEENNKEQIDYKNKENLDHEDFEIFEDLFDEIPKDDETPSTKTMTSLVPKGELGIQPKVPKGELLEPSLITNHNSNQPLPDWLDINAWEKWVAYRTEIKKKLTRLMVKEQIEFLSHHIDSHVAIINTSIMNGWQGLFEIKNKQNPTKKPHPYESGLS